jgi:iron complex transport system permease protein
MVGLALVAAAACMAVAARLLVVRTLDGSLLIGWPGPTLGQFRVDAVLVACSAGAALGASGAILQTLLRNPLASPFVLGVTSGAGAGVAFASLAAAMAGIAAPTGAALGVPALAGALAALGCVLLLSRRHGALDPVTLILGGVIVGAIASAGSTVAESLLPPERRGLLTGWLFGRIPDVPDAGALAACAAAALGLTGLGTAWGNRLDGAALCDDEARSIGIALGPMRTAMFIGCGVATAATVALCGPIAFVGLLAPHCARALVGARNRLLVPGAALAGAGLLTAADALRQWIDVGGGRLPLGAVTAVFGGLAFLVLLRRTAAGWMS